MVEASIVKVKLRGRLALLVFAVRVDLLKELLVLFLELLIFADKFVDLL